MVPMGAAAEPSRPTAVPETITQVIRVDVRGAVAHVTVTRTFPCGASRPRTQPVTEPMTDTVPRPGPAGPIGSLER